MVFMAFACSLLQASEPEDFVFQDPDTTAPQTIALRDLETMPAADALHYLLALGDRVNPGDASTAAAIRDEGARLTAANPKVAAYYRDALEKLPISARTQNLRSNCFSHPLESLPAEWTVRLLANQVSADVPLSRISDTSATNAEMAAGVLLQMKLKDWYQPDPSLPPDQQLTAHREWIAAHSDEIPGIVKATWGTRAVMNRDLGLGPDNLPRASKAPREAPTPAGNRGINTPPSANDSASNFPLFPTLGLTVILGMVVAMMIGRKARGGCQTAGH